MSELRSLVSDGHRSIESGNQEPRKWQRPPAFLSDMGRTRRGELSLLKAYAGAIGDVIVSSGTIAKCSGAILFARNNQ